MKKHAKQMKRTFSENFHSIDVLEKKVRMKDGEGTLGIEKVTVTETAMKVTGTMEIDLIAEDGKAEEEKTQIHLGTEVVIKKEAIVGGVDLKYFIMSKILSLNLHFVP